MQHRRGQRRRRLKERWQDAACAQRVERRIGAEAPKAAAPKNGANAKPLLGVLLAIMTLALFPHLLRALLVMLAPLVRIGEVALVSLHLADLGGFTIQLPLDDSHAHLVLPLHLPLPLQHALLLIKTLPVLALDAGHGPPHKIEQSRHRGKDGGACRPQLAGGGEALNPLVLVGHSRPLPALDPGLLQGGDGELQ